MRLSLIAVVAVILSLPTFALANGAGGTSSRDGGKESTPASSNTGSSVPSTIRALKERIVEIQNRSPLMIADFTLCRTVEGYGSFVPFPNNTVTNAKEIQFYFEPVNLFTSVGRDGYAVSFTQDIQLLSSAGEVLFRETNFRSFSYRGNKPALDIYGANKLDITGLAPGEYVYKITVNDQLNNASVDASLTFTIR